MKDVVKKFFRHDVSNVSGRLDCEIKIRFKKLMKKPAEDDFLQNFLNYLTASSPEETVKIYKSLNNDILDEVIQRDLSFLDSRR